MSKRVADVIFPNLPKTYAEYEAQYPPRNCAATRFAPSPTGFMHIGGLYTALINCLFAKRKPIVLVQTIRQKQEAVS